MNDSWLRRLGRVQGHLRLMVKAAAPPRIICCTLRAEDALKSDLPSSCVTVPRNEHHNSLTPEQLKHFAVFGFVVLRRVLTEAELNRVNDEYSKMLQLQKHFIANTNKTLQLNWDNLQGSMYVQSLLEDDRFIGNAEMLLGGQAICFASQSNLYSSDRSPWHADQPQDHPHSLKFVLYIEEPLNATSGALRVIPGSHTAEFGDALARVKLIDVDPGRHLPIVQGIGLGDSKGLQVDEVPCAVLNTRPGDVIAFDQRVWHASWGGGVARRMISMTYYKQPKTEAEMAAMRTCLEERMARRKGNESLYRAFPKRWLANESQSPVRHRWIEWFRQHTQGFA